MKYIKNKAMEFLDIDDDNTAVYDPEIGDTHYIDDTGKVILSLLDNEIDEDDLIEKLCEIYSAQAEEITEDVHEFLSELTEKKVVVCI